MAYSTHFRTTTEITEFDFGFLVYRNYRKVVSVHTEHQFDMLLPLELQFVNASILCSVTNSIKRDLQQSNDKH